jgi:hypothetical protein
MGSKVLHEHTGCAIRPGLPVSVWVRGEKLKEYLEHFEDKKNIRICLFYEGTTERVYSDPIPIKLVEKILS